MSDVWEPDEYLKHRDDLAGNRKELVESYAKLYVVMAAAARAEREARSVLTRHEQRIGERLALAHLAGTL